MSGSGGKATSPSGRAERDSVQTRAPGGSGAAERRSPPPADYPVCRLRSPTLRPLETEAFDGVPSAAERDESPGPEGRPSEGTAPPSTGNSEEAALPSGRSGETEVPTPRTRFDSGDEVLFTNEDGRFYLGTVVSAETSGDRWLVRFDDGTQRSAGAAELRPLSSPSGSDAPAMCVVCKLSDGSGGEEVIACDKCSRGYHPGCHVPPVELRMRDASWHCKLCVNRRQKAAAAEHRAQRKAEMVKSKHSRRTFPYDLQSLIWDPNHRTNMDNVYCYCGKSGDWFAQMLQCTRCRQWFHQQCIPSLKYPLYTGDRFYVFICLICNNGTEFISRIEMKWVDLVHLALFNLTMFHSKKYFDLDTVIIPYTSDNWHALQLPQKMHITTLTERRELILSALSNNENRFKCGREIKKRTTIWGLRSRTPPPPPPVSPTDEKLSGKCGRLVFVPYPQENNKMNHDNGDNYQHMIVPADNHWHSLMMGKRFQTSSGSDGESPRSTPSPMPISDISSGYQFSNDFMNRQFSSHRSKDESVESDYLSSEDMPLIERLEKPVKQKEYKFYEINYQGGGLVKKSVPFPKIPFSKKQKGNQRSKKHRDSHHRSKKFKNLGKDEMLNRTKRKLRKSAKQQKKAHKSLLSKNTNNIPDQEGSSFCPLEEEHLSKESSAFSSFTPIRSTEVILPPTPPTSMSAPPTPPAVNAPGSNSNSCDVPSDFQLSHSTFKKETTNSDSDNDLADFKDAQIKSLLSISDRKIKTVGNSPENESKTELEANPTSQMNGVVTKSSNFKLAQINLEISKLSTKNIIEHSKIMSLHHIKVDDVYSAFSQNKVENDSSGDDTSSRGTLDSIIPHPANFKGTNNPFHNVNNNLPDQFKNNAFASIGLGKGSSCITNKLLNRHSFTKQNSPFNLKKGHRISLPVNLNPVIKPGVKLMKRQLSEKDLIIGPNGEVKRRRHRRSKASLPQAQFAAKDVSLNERQKSLRSSLSQDDINKNANVVIDNQQITTTADQTVKSRCLRQRQEKNYSDRRRGSTSSNNTNSSLVTVANVSTPNVQSISGINTSLSGVRSLNLSPQSNHCTNEQWNKSDDIQDLKTSVHSYFGAANRIAAGEKFTISGKRITESGKLHYLIEWEGHGS